MPEYIDTHTHNSDEAFANDADNVVANALAAGVTHLIQADISTRERDAMFDLCRQYPGVLHPMLGLYPGSVGPDWQDELAAVESHDRTGVVAIGEIGLDYHYGKDTAREQKEAFRVQLELSARWNLPVNIHLRDASPDFITIIEDCRHLGLRGNLHAYSGSAEFFRRLRRSGDWYVGIGGVLTFRNAGIAREITDIPLDRILLETDSPYLSPTPLRGRRNESANIPLIAAALAGIKGVSVEDVAAVTTSNAKKLFAI